MAIRLVPREAFEIDTDSGVWEIQRNSNGDWVVTRPDGIVVAYAADYRQAESFVPRKVVSHV